MAKVTPSIKSSKPTTSTETEAKVKKTSKRVKHTLVGNKDAKIYPFATLPTDFDFAKHAGLKKKDFANTGEFFEYKAKECEAKAAAFRVKAKEESTTGGGKAKQKARRLVKMIDKMDELKKQLALQGINVEELLKATAAEKPAETPAQA